MDYYTTNVIKAGTKPKITYPNYKLGVKLSIETFQKQITYVECDLDLKLKAEELSKTSELSFPIIQTILGIVGVKTLNENDFKELDTSDLYNVRELLTDTEFLQFYVMTSYYSPNKHISVITEEAALDSFLIYKEIYKEKIEEFYKLYPELEEKFIARQKETEAEEKASNRGCLGCLGVILCIPFLLILCLLIAGLLKRARLDSCRDSVDNPGWFFNPTSYNTPECNNYNRRYDFNQRHQTINFNPFI